MAAKDGAHCGCVVSQGEVPERCTPEVMRAVFRQHLESPTMWTIFPIQVPNAGPRMQDSGLGQSQGSGKINVGIGSMIRLRLRFQSKSAQRARQHPMPVTCMASLGVKSFQKCLADYLQRRSAGA